MAETSEPTVWQGLLEFLTSATAPWWSGLLGILLGGIGTYLTTKRADERRLELEHAKDRRDKVLIAVTDFLKAEFEAYERLLSNRAEYSAATGEAYPARTPEQRSYIEDQTQHFAPYMRKLQIEWLRLELIGGEELYEAARHLTGIVDEFSVDMPEEKFIDWRDKITDGVARVTHKASLELNPEKTTTEKSGPRWTALRRWRKTKTSP